MHLNSNVGETIGGSTEGEDTVQPPVINNSASSESPKSEVVDNPVFNMTTETETRKRDSIPTLEITSSTTTNASIATTTFTPTPTDVISNGNLNSPSPTQTEGSPSPSSSSMHKSGSQDSLKSRGGWGNKWEFLLSCVGLSVGIGNVWRFPYLAYENGGGAFLIPYLVMLTLAGRPMYFMELVLGQFAGTGPLTIWRCSPIMKGVGASMVIGSAVVCIYYNVVMAYSIYFMTSSFSSVLPWTKCDPSWTDCVVRSANNTLTNGTKSASQLYWERSVLDISSGIEDLGGIKWDLALCLLVCWVIVILCLLKGVKTSGKVIYFAATFPYVILLCLLVAGLTQTGAWEGIKFFIIPDWSKLFTIKVWAAAASQMFFSLSVAMGGLIMYSSYNDFRHDIFRDAMVVSVLDTATSIISGLVIFSILGAMSHELGVDIKQVVKGGPGLAFVAYPEALARLPYPQVWSVLFFFMLFTLGLDSEFAMLENIITSIADEIELVRRHKLKFTIATGALFFCLGLVCVTRGGQYVFQILDYYGGSIPLMFLAVGECVGLMWVYGYDKFAFDVNYMLNCKLGWYWKVTWKYTAPCVLGFIIVASLADHTPLKYEKYDYPAWADVIGWCLTLLIVGQIPLWALFAVLRQSSDKSFMQKVSLASAETTAWGPANSKTKEDWLSKRQDMYLPQSSESKEPATLKKFSKITPAINDAFEPDLP